MSFAKNKFLCKQDISLIFLLGASLLFNGNAEASPNSLTYQGRILKSDGQGLEYSNVSFLFEITSEDGSCVLFREQKDGVNLVNSKGVFDVAIGTGTRLFPDVASNPTFKLSDSFVNGVSHNCSGSGTWASSVDSFRKLKVQFHDGVGWKVISPDNVIRSVPFALTARSATQLGDKTINDFVLKTNLPGASCVAGQVVYWDGTNLSCVTDAGGSGVISDVLAGTGVSVAGTTTKTISVNIGSTAGTVAAGNDSRIANALQSSTVFAGDISGNYSAISVDKIKGVAVSGPAPTTGQVLKFDGSNWSAANPTLGTVTSVGLSVPSFLSVSGGPVTSSGTLAVSLASQTANTVFAAPSGSAGAPSFRTLKINDIYSSIGGLSFLNTTPSCAAGTALTYVSATDRIECATVAAAWANISGKPTTLSGYGITDAVSSSTLSSTLNSYVAKAGDSMTGTLTTSGNIGVGTNSPSFPLDVQSSGAFQARLYHASNGANDGAALMMTRTRGSVASGVSVQNNDTIGGFYFRAHDGAGTGTTSAAIEVSASEDQSATNRGNRIIFETTAVGSASRSERMRVHSNGNIGINTTNPSEKLEVNGNIKATQLCIGADCRSAWPAASGGTVTNVSSANAYLTVANSGTTPTITANVGTVANTLAAGNDARFTDSRTPTGSAAGDLGGTYPNPSVNKIRGVTVVSTTPLDGQVYRYNNSTTQFEPVYFGVDDLRTSVGASQFSTSCTSSQTLTWSAVTDAFTCANIANLDAAVIASGTIASARLPASATYWSAATGGINYAGGNVGIGTAIPGQKLSVAGVIESTAGGIKFPDGSTQTTAASGSSGVVFGAWISRSADTVYQAPSDGVVVVNPSSCGYGYYSVFSDSNNPPTTERIKGKAYATGGSQAGATIPVKKDDYWKVTTTYSCAPDAIFWIPYVSGTPSNAAAGSTGQVQINNSGVLVGNSGLNYDLANNRLGIGTAAPTNKLEVVGGTTKLEQAPWIYPTLTNGWSNYGLGYANFGYRIDSMGYLRLRGLIKNGAAGSANAFFTLPVGYRPQYIVEFSVAAPSGTANIIIGPTGVMYVETMSSNAWISLDNVSIPLD